MGDVLFRYPGEGPAHCRIDADCGVFSLSTSDRADVTDNSRMGGASRAQMCTRIRTKYHVTEIM